MTPALRLLQKEGVPHTEHPYEYDAEVDAIGLAAAEALGVEPERVFKTLVCQADSGELYFLVIPAATRIDFKKLARHLGVRKAGMADPTLAERTTGYVVGGICPLGGRRRLPVLADPNLAGFPTVLINAGRRGLLVELAPDDLIRLTEAELVEVTSSAG